MCPHSRGCRFIVRKGAPGYQAVKMDNKIGLRIVQNGDITLPDVFVPERDRLPGVKTFKDTNRVSGIRTAIKDAKAWITLHDGAIARASDLTIVSLMFRPSMLGLWKRSNEESMP